MLSQIATFMHTSVVFYLWSYMWFLLQPGSNSRATEQGCLSLLLWTRGKNKVSTGLTHSNYKYEISDCTEASGGWKWRTELVGDSFYHSARLFRWLRILYLACVSKEYLDLLALHSMREHCHFYNKSVLYGKEPSFKYPWMHVSFSDDKRECRQCLLSQSKMTN